MDTRSIRADDTDDFPLWFEGWKHHIAREFGTALGAETTSRANGSVGGEITKRMVGLAEAEMSELPWDTGAP